MGLLVAFGDDPNFVLSRRRLPPALHAAAAAVPDARAASALSIINESCAQRARRDLLRGHLQHRCSSAPRAELFFGFDALQRRGVLRLRRAVPVLAVLLHRRDLGRRSRSRCSASGCSASTCAARSKGPTPWHVHGSAAISLLFFDISTSTSTSPGASAATTTLPPIEVLPLLTRRVREGGELAGDRCRRRACCSSACASWARPDALVLHPVGTLRVSQRFAAARPRRSTRSATRSQRTSSG